MRFAGACFLAVALLAVGQAEAAVGLGQGPKAPEAFQKLETLVRARPDMSESDFWRILEAFGFTLGHGGVYTLKDDDGETTVIGSPGSGFVFLRHEPTLTPVIAEQIVASMIQKSRAVSLYGGDALQLEIDVEHFPITATKGYLTAERKSGVYFSLEGCHLLGSYVSYAFTR